MNRAVSVSVHRGAVLRGRSKMKKPANAKRSVFKNLARKGRNGISKDVNA